MAVAEGQQKIDALRAGGFSQADIDAWQTQARQELVQGGFSDGEVADYFGEKPFNNGPLKTYFKENPDWHPPMAAPKDGASEKGQPHEAHGLMEAFQSGYQASSAGLAIRGQVPDIVTDDKSTFAEKLAHSAGMVTGDLPASAAGMIMGGLAGTAAAPGPGTAVGAGFGGMALPAGLRKIMMDHYEKGEIKTAQDFWDRASGAFAEAMKEGVIGGVTGGAGALGGKAAATLTAEMASPVAKAITQTAVPLTSELAAMTTAGAAIQGKLPDWDEFANSAVTLVGLHAAGYAAKGVTGKLVDIYKQTGIRPADVAQMADADPALKQQILSTDTGLPKSLEWAKDPNAQSPKTAEIKAPESMTTESSALGPADPDTKPVVQVGDAPEAPAKSEINPQKLTPEETQKLTVDQAHEAIRGRLAAGDENKPAISLPSVADMNRAVIDDLDPVLRLMKEAMGEKTTRGVMEKVDPLENPYLLMRNTRGNVGRARTMISDHTYDFNTLESNGKGLQEILEPFDRKSGELEKFENFITASRAVELNERGIETGMDTELAKKITEDPAQQKRYGAAAKELVGFQNRVLKYLKDSGVLSDTDYAKITNAGEKYVPFFRLMEDDQAGIGKGLKVKNPLVEIKGSDAKVIQPIESIIRKTYEYVTLAERNRALLALKNFGEKYEGFMEKTAVDQKSEGKLADLGIGGKETGDVVRTHKALEKDEIAIFDKGRREVFKVDPEVARAVSGLDTKGLNLVEKILAKPASTLRAGATLTPDFVFKNLFRDQIHAFVASPNGYMPLYDYVSGLMSMAKQDEAFHAWMKGGGMSSAVVSMDRHYIESHVMQISKETGFLRSAQNVITQPLEALRVLAELGETPTRIGEFKRSAKGDFSAASSMKAAHDSRNVTLDFQRKGANIAAVNAMIPFWNAKNQGIAQVAELLRERTAPTLFKGAAAIALPSLLTWLVNRNDPRYEELKPWEKDLFWIVMTDNWQPAREQDAKGNPMGREVSPGQWQMNRGTVYRFPKPQELGILMGSSLERTLDAFFVKHPESFASFASQVIDMAVPDVGPALPKAVVEHLTNYSFFNKQKIVPYDVEKLLPELRYAPYTSETAKFLSQKVADLSEFIGLGRESTFSPAVMDHYVNAWAGGLGRYGVSSIDWALQKSGVVSKPDLPESKWSELPFVRAFTIRFPATYTRSIEKFYENYENIQEWTNSEKALEKGSDAERFGRVVQSDKFGEMKSAQGDIERFAKEMREVKKAIADIGASDMPAHDKRQLTDNLMWYRIGIAKMGNHLFEQIQSQMKNIKH